MTKKHKKIIVQVVIVVFAITFIRFYQQQNLINGNAPSIATKSINNNEITLTTQRNTSSLVHFWATWCGICALENSNIQNIIADGNYNILNIAWASGSNEDLIKYAQEHKLDINTIINDQYGTLAKSYGVNATPSSFIVDSNGKIIFTEVGYTTELGLRLRLWWASI